LLKIYFKEKEVRRFFASSDSPRRKGYPGFSRIRDGCINQLNFFEERRKKE
jgi:hypothetical protein